MKSSNKEEIFADGILSTSCASILKVKVSLIEMLFASTVARTDDAVKTLITDTQINKNLKLYNISNYQSFSNFRFFD